MEFNDAYSVIDTALKSQRTLIVVGNCEVEYHGRATSKLAKGDRIVIVKQDGSFLVHQNKNLAAINYQPPKGNRLAVNLDGNTLVLQASRKTPKELLKTIFNRIDFAQSFDLKDDKSLILIGSEKNLARELMKDLDSIEKGLIPLKNESVLQRGMVDILAKDKDGNLVVIELKRRTATLDSVSQLKRYVNEVNKQKGVKVRGILCAPHISSNAKVFLEREGLSFCKLDYEVTKTESLIKGLESKQKGISEFV